MAPTRPAPFTLCLTEGQDTPEDAPASKDDAQKKQPRVRPEMQRVGRPSKLTEQRRKDLITAISSGTSIEAACAYAGISHQTLRNWLKRGEKAKEGEFFEFFEEVTRARDEAEVPLVTVVRKAALDGDWRAAFALLGCVNRKRYGPPTKPEPEPPGRDDEHERDRELLGRIARDPEAREALAKLTALELREDKPSGPRPPSLER